MKSTSIISATVCLGSVLAFTAFAQENPGTTPPMGGSSIQGQSLSDLRVSKAIGAEVKTAQGEKLGKLEDFILNQASGRVDFAVLDWNNKLVPVPFSLLTASPATGRSGLFSSTSSHYTFTAKVDTTKLQNAPTIDKNRWTDIQQAGWSHKVYSYYGVSHEGMGAPGSEPGIGTGSSEKNREKGKDYDADDPTPE